MLKASTSKFSSTSQRGATFIEATLSISFLFTVLLISFQLLSIGYSAIAVQFAAAFGVRQVIIGPPSSPPPGYDHAAELLQSVMDFCDRLGVSVETADIQICPLASQNCGTISLGSSGDVITVSVSRTIPFLVFGNVIEVSGFAMGRNEPT